MGAPASQSIENIVTNPVILFGTSCSIRPCSDHEADGARVSRGAASGLHICVRKRVTSWVKHPEDQTEQCTCADSDLGRLQAHPEGVALSHSDPTMLKSSYASSAQQRCRAAPKAAQGQA